MLEKYPDTKFYDDPQARAEPSTLTCECGQTKLYVNFIAADFCGCYLKVTCSDCGKSEIIFDDYS